MEKKSLKELKKLVLQNKIVEVKPILRDKAYFKKSPNGEPHDGTHTYTGCNKSHGLPFDSKKRAYVNPFLSEDPADEQEAFERLLDQKEGALNLYKFTVNEPNFWGKFSIRIPKEGIKLNLNMPSDALIYRIFLVDLKFAVNLADSSVAERVYLIVDEEEQKEVAGQLSRKKDKAENYMFNLKKSKKDMINTLRLLGRKPDKDSDADWLKGELYKVKDEVTTSKGVPGLDKFIAVLEDPLKDTKLFVLDAVDAQHIRRTKTGYVVEHNNAFVGRKIEDVIQYFSKNDPDVLETKTILQEQLK